MNFKKFISGVSALTIAASAFAGMAVTANAKNTSDGDVQALQDFESYAAGDVTTVVGTSFTDSGSTKIDRLTPNTSSGSRIIFNNSMIVQDGTNKYFSTEIKPNNGNKTDFYNVGALYFGGRDGTAYNRSLGQTRVFTADVRFYGATQIILADQTNSTPRSGYKDYLDLSYASGTISWAGTGTKSVDSGWHSIVAIDTAGSSFVEGTGVSHTTKLYIDGEYIGSNTTNQNNTANGANHIGFAAFLAATTTQTKIDVDNLEIFTLAQDSANSAVVSVVGGGAASIDPTSETKTLQLSGKVVHNTTDNIDITDFYSTTPTWEINPAVTGVSVDNTGLVTVSNEFDVEANDSATVVYTAGAKNTSLNINISTARGYVINTTPYAAISVDGAAAVSTGSEGKYQFALDTTGDHSVVISKEGYQTVNTTVTAANNGSTTLALNPNTGVVYQEDFTYVDDSFGFEEGAVTIANGVLSRGGSSTVTTTSSPVTPSVADKLTTVTAMISTTGRNAILNLDGSGIYITFRMGNVKFGSLGNDQGPNIEANKWYKIQIYTPTSGHAIMYIDGKKHSAESMNIAGNPITGYTLGGSGGTNTVSVDSVVISDKPADVTVTTNDDGTSSSTTYLAGTSFTLPEAAGKDGYTFEGWSDGTNTYAAGTALTADATKTYTAVYTQIVAPSANLVAADWTADAATGYEASGNVLTDTKGNSVYGYKATLEGNGYAYDTVNVFVTTLKGNTDEKTYDDTTFSADASGVVFYVISNVALDTDASRVYCK